MSPHNARVTPGLVAFATVAALVVSPALARAQACSAADASAGICLIDPTPAQATPTTTAFGVTPNAATRVYAQFVGGLAFFSGSIYAFASAPDSANPLATQNVLIGSKPRGGLLTLANPWIQLPWSVGATGQLYFGLLENEITDFNNLDATTPRWFLSGYGTSSDLRYDQAGKVSPAFSLVFGATGPVGDQTNPSDPQSSRQPTPAEWQAANIAPPAGAGANSRTFFVGFEDSRFASDGDFNDFVVAVNVSSVPEPSTIALFATGLGALGLAARRRRRR